MSTIVPPPISAAVALGPISQILPAQYRFAGDDWDDEAAFLFTFYTTLPTFDPTTGAVLTAGQVRDLTDCTFSGTCRYRPRTVTVFPALPPPSAPPAVWSQDMVGRVDVDHGQASLTLSSDRTTFARQSFDVWTPGVPGFESSAALEVRGRLTDPYGKTVTQGVIPLFVF